MKTCILLLCLTVSCHQLLSQDIFTTTAATNSIAIVSGGTAAQVYTDTTDFTLVQKAAMWFRHDIENVTGLTPGKISIKPRNAKTIIIIGSLERSALVKELVKNKKINVDGIKGKWEAYLIQVVNKPFAGIDHALVIAGSDRRGTAFGVFELSKAMGVSPWYWWSDVPIKKSEALHVSNSLHITDAPKVKYRGIFINDEAPALSGWSREKFGGFNHKFYEKVFELMLRLKSNYLWPAMWGNAFYDDDPLNKKMADDYGIVIGTSHHEPLMRAHDEWRRYGQGKWNYDSNAVRLGEFWKKGIERATNEKIVSIGMRGDGDEPMTRETATALLERIVKDQRSIISTVTKKPAEATPQLWALYKEVQDYYDKGMRVPDDVTLLLCDDNWGNIRKLPARNAKPRKGGYGIYYHFDYVGGPRNYKWVNTNPIPRVWEQMHLAWQHNARQIWIVNVGDIKPMEFPISFFLDYAWNPERIGADDLQRYTTDWCTKQFGSEYAVDIAGILSSYLKYNGRRKPELLDQQTYSLTNYNEFQKVIDDYNEVKQRSSFIASQLPIAYKDAYFQLVDHPVRACANLNELYFYTAKNHAAAEKGWAEANQYADRVKQHYLLDSLLTIEYHQMNGGKWNHMMSQTHIGYTYWQQPPVNKVPLLRYIDNTAASGAYIPPPQVSRSAALMIPAGTKGNTFYELGELVSIEAAHYTRAIPNNGITWKVLPDHGRTADAITTFPVTAVSQQPGANSPRLEYEFYSYSADSVTLHTYFSPTLNFHNNAEGLQYAIAIDDGPPQLVSINKEDHLTQQWNRWVANNIIIKSTKHRISEPGKHVIKYWMVDPGVVLQKLVVDCGGLKPSYLGPPETRFDERP